MINEQMSYDTMVYRKNALQKKVGKLEKSEIVLRLRKLGFGPTRAEEIASKWIADFEAEKKKKEEMKASHDKWLAKVKEMDEKYGEKPAKKYSKKGNLAKAFADEWNKKDLGVKAKYVEEEAIEEGLFGFGKSQFEKDTAKIKKIEAELNKKEKELENETDPQQKAFMQQELQKRRLQLSQLKMMVATNNAKRRQNNY